MLATGKVLRSACPEEVPCYILLYKESAVRTGFSGLSPHGTLTYLKCSTMAVTIPVTISTIPRTQKRPVHEVKSTCQEGGMRDLSDNCHH